MVETYENFIDGAWCTCEDGDSFENLNPADTSDVIGRFQRSTAVDAERAVAAAKDATAVWAETPAPARGAILAETADRLADRADELTETLVREEGKARPEAAGEVGRAVDIFRYYAAKTREIGGDVAAPSATDKTLYTVDEPLGVVGLITPWNYPIAIPAWKIAPALATGNTVVFKPATLAPNIARKLVACLEAAGLPDGVLNYVTGPGSEVGSTVASHNDVEAVSFTGSSAVGQTVYDQATATGKRIQTEMGGKNPVVVTEHADPEEAAEIAASGAFGVTGQACTATSRAIVHESVHDAFVEEVVERARAIEIGPGLDGGEMGPHVSNDELEGTLDYVDLGVSEGATLETGGERVEDGDRANGYFVEPTVFTDVAPSMRIAQEEIFGPVLAVIRVTDFDEAVTVANDTEYGLTASVVTSDLREAHRFISESEVGVVKVNEKTTGLELHVPFGGRKASSSDTIREQGEAPLDFFTSSKTVYLNY